VAWDAALYLKYGEERTRACVDLAARVPLKSPRLIADIGCGPGNSTAVLRARWPMARVIGVDNSPEMLERARRDCPDGEWVLADAGERVAPENCDLIFSNATLHWVKGHGALLGRWMGQLNDGGVLAAQVPYQLRSKLHEVMRRVAAEGPWAAKLAEAADVMEVLGIGEYYELLTACATKVDLWVTEYVHVMDGPEAVVEWISGTGLRPILGCLDGTEKEKFLRQFTGKVASAFPRMADGKVLLPFPRLFFVAEKGKNSGREPTRRLGRAGIEPATHGFSGRRGEGSKAGEEQGLRAEGDGGAAQALHGDADLAFLMAEWPRLRPSVRRRVLALVRSSRVASGAGDTEPQGGRRSSASAAAGGNNPAVGTAGGCGRAPAAQSTASAAVGGKNQVGGSPAERRPPVHHQKRKERHGKRRKCAAGDRTRR